MKSESQLRQESQLRNNSQYFLGDKSFLERYIDVVIQGMISFVLFGSFYYFVLYRWLNLPVYWSLPIIFVLSIPVSNFISRVTLGTKVREWYDIFLYKLSLRIMEKHRKMLK